MSTPTPVSPQSLIPSSRRKFLLSAAAASFVVLAFVYGAYWFVSARYDVSTDDAYVSGNVIQVTPQITGTVVAVRADDTDYVQAGQPLVSIDDVDTRLALDQAKATFSQTLREVRALYSNEGALVASVSLQETNLARLQEDLARRQKLAGTGAVSAEELKHARDAVQTANDQLNNVRKQLEGNRVLVDNTTLADHPRVKMAAARLREAYLAWRRTQVPAPVSGQVARRSVQVGQRTAPGTPLMAVVPLEQLWVDANFKEGQLSAMRIGQPATLTADLYGSSVTYHGKVVGLSAGTGSAFSLLPAQNATGNWIKVVQRLPVRIALDPAELKAHPLRIGLSMVVEVTVKDESGPQLSTGKQADTVAETSVFGDMDRDVDHLISELSVQNSGLAQ
ncbi:multidrug efflux system [uncultured Desulfovibrio sp.]|uniref:Multidrug efflux system n=1 Tax=uncultured Desulfovibrio sp. TaxID=167968 RepID=A0A212JDX9_9BACT|nr:HlyD family efflux transporter periplasmic adaptor subunit [Desulfovibrio desulfuricans]MCB6542215.1 HlyD family efflux transporter periplasmic adaptor subunit [Desulfovibrio desulfuricans]MCB6553843.1 HlyD family efflux transporter periplasmic adaptor subunit [Desulfovibrio desulfuricans]MCB6565258.1 HlyD family efflux transporter periplasmic adaptor subunit [Desulfovibrio desulfuricans]MCB7346320.1 HlyD family efflux transporter periplasmic adaptor subunit [Desulfovibrio desulfuricans]MCQ